MTTNNSINFDTPFYIGGWYVDPSSGRIKYQNTETKLEPKVMAVLVCLAQRTGEVVTREQLEETVWAGMVVGYDSLANAIIKLRKAFADDAKNPKVIETLPKKGYRLLLEVRLTHTESAPVTPAAKNTGFVAIFSNADHKHIIIMVFIASLLLSAVWYLDPFTTRLILEDDESKIPIVAVLPFRNLSNDPEQNYFSDGLTDDLITDLSKLSRLSVVARNPIFSYRNSKVDITKLGVDLGVSYIIEGSVRKSNDKLRISARLIDVSNKQTIWAERFDGAVNEVFAFQDEVTSAIISSLKVKLSHKEQLRLAHKYSKSIAAYDEFLRGWESLWLSSRDNVLQARVYFYKAIDLDANFARAYSNLALTYLYDYIYGWSDDPEKALMNAHLYADTAIRLDDQLPQVHWVKGYADIYSRDYLASIKQAETAIELAPNSADGYGLLATTLNYAGRPQQAALEMENAMRLNPLHPSQYKVIYAEILFNNHDYINAIKNFKLALQSNPELEEPRLWLAAALANNGEIDDAEWELEHIRAAGSNLSLQRIQKIVPFKLAEQRQHLIDGLFRAGLKQ